MRTYQVWKSCIHRPPRPKEAGPHSNWHPKTEFLAQCCRDLVILKVSILIAVDGVAGGVLRREHSPIILNTKAFITALKDRLFWCGLRHMVDKRLHSIQCLSRRYRTESADCLPFCCYVLAPFVAIQNSSQVQTRWCFSQNFTSVGRGECALSPDTGATFLRWNRVTQLDLQGNQSCRLTL